MLFALQADITFKLFQFPVIRRLWNDIPSVFLSMEPYHSNAFFYDLYSINIGFIYVQKHIYFDCILIMDTVNKVVVLLIEHRGTSWK